jgi:5'-phosphate synthase pdxT subunit
MKIGVLGLQGDYAAHGHMLEGLDCPWSIVKKPEQLSQVDGLIIPGGESTTLIKLMDSWDFWQPLQDFANAGKPLLGTCAGLIILAKEVRNPPQKSLGVIDLVVERNSYGRQIDSFEGTGTFAANGTDATLPMIFIRAPRILQLGKGVQELGHCNGDCVIAQQDNVLVVSFHPELTEDLTVHRYLVGMAQAK